MLGHVFGHVKVGVVDARDVAVVILLFPVWITVNKMHGAEEEEHSTVSIEHVFYSVSVEQRKKNTAHLVLNMCFIV